MQGPLRPSRASALDACGRARLRSPQNPTLSARQSHAPAASSAERANVERANAERAGRRARTEPNE